MLRLPHPTTCLPVPHTVSTNLPDAQNAPPGTQTPMAFHSRRPAITLQPVLPKRQPSFRYLALRREQTAMPAKHKINTRLLLLSTPVCKASPVRQPVRAMHTSLHTRHSRQPFSRHGNQGSVYLQHGTFFPAAVKTQKPTHIHKKACRKLVRHALSLYSNFSFYKT